MENMQYLLFLLISMFLGLGVLYIISLYKGSNKQIKLVMSLLVAASSVWCLSLIFQILFQNTNISKTTFEGFASFGACFLPLLVLFLGITFTQTKFKFKWYYSFLFIIPIVSTILMFTNDAHHLFYTHYSIYLFDTTYGPYFAVHSIFSYGCLFIGLLILFIYSIRNAGFFSRQSLLLVLGTLIPIVVNLLGFLGVINANVYITPITFSFALYIYAVAIFKFKFISVAPIALQRVVDRMSDCYMVLNEDNIITDFNKTLLTSFNLREKDVRNTDIVTLIKTIGEKNIDINLLLEALKKVKSTTDTLNYRTEFSSIDKYFNIEVNSINSKGSFLGTLILLKDETQHYKDMNIIKSNQDLLMEKERLASLGELIGGIAHNLKTPIMSISGAAEGLSDLVKEYDSSIDDPEVNSQDHHDIAKDMNEWIEKIKTHTSYMSDVITAVKGQAVNLNASNEVSNFTIEELVKRVSILMKHELKANLIDMNISVNVDPNLKIDGNVNSLVQVINNMISNAIQSYNGKTNENIDLIISNYDEHNIGISIKDYGCGMSKEVQSKLFKQMVTTKGKKGTGLGLFMSYSTIRGNFKGNVKFTSEENKGTTFIIILPYNA